MARADIVLFDLDGTLSDSAPGILASIRYALDSMGVPHPDDATLRTSLGPPLAVTFRDSFGMSSDDVELAIARYRERYHDIGLFENEVYPGIPELLDGLQGAGIPMAIATSKPTYSATRILEHFDLTRHFAFIGGADLEGTRHDKAAVIAHTRAELGALGVQAPPERTVMIGDRSHDVEGARQHGIDTIGVLWGYGDEAELRGAGAVGIAPTVSTLGDMLRG